MRKFYSILNQLIHQHTFLLSLRVLLIVFIGEKDRLKGLKICKDQRNKKITHVKSIDQVIHG